MPDAFLFPLIVGLRIAVAVSWSIIGVLGFAGLTRLAGRVGQKGDVPWAALTFVAAGLLIFQWGALTGEIAVENDPLVAIALLAFLIGAIGIFVARALRAPEEHQHATAVSYLAMIAALLAAGLLSS